MDRSVAAVSDTTLVAIVDDDPRIQDLLGAELTDLNQRHCAYSTAEDLLAELDDRQPQLIFLDVLMPGMGGMACLQELRKRGYTGSIVMFTALNDAHLQDQAKKSGANGWILKANLFDDVENLINSYLDAS